MKTITEEDMRSENEMYNLRKTSSAKFYWIRKIYYLK